ncbi:hypothetical protein [Psychroflexus aestuariivivens]|uniref:hypothetical protein n=1 Tax=Psychroflexus aestuariivivens TaxID=1795040 RepID=UPI000FD81FA8|nr:hypothetical protein [Psychroflexus aestuariivivens]
MKKYLSIICIPVIFFIGISNSNAQEGKYSSDDVPRVEKSIYDIQVGFLGAWITNERRIFHDQVALRTEIGFIGGFGESPFVETVQNSDNFYFFIPDIRLEPRVYYNFHERLEKGRRISNNSGNFWAFSIRYNSDFMKITNATNISAIDQVAFIPKWGIRRDTGMGVTYEIGFGLGYVKYLNYDSYLNNDSGAILDLHIRFGFTFNSFKNQY